MRIINYIFISVFFVLILSALVLIFNLSFKDIRLAKRKKKDFTQKELKALKIQKIVPKKLSYMERRKKESLEVIEQGKFNITYDKFQKIMLICAACGVVLGILMNNPFLSIVLLVSFTYIPDIFFSFKQISKTKVFDDKLQTALAMVSSSYIQNPNIKLAVEESLPRMEEPIASMFKEFLVDLSIDSDPVRAVRLMKEKVNNRFFNNWADDFITCCDDREVRPILNTHIDDMSAYKEEQADFDSMMYNILMTFGTLGVIEIAVIPLMSLLGKEYFDFYINNMIGKVLVAIAIALLLISISKVIYHCRPLSKREGGK